MRIIMSMRSTLICCHGRTERQAVVRLAVVRLAVVRLAVASVLRARLCPLWRGGAPVMHRFLYLRARHVVATATPAHVDRPAGRTPAQWARGESASTKTLHEVKAAQATEWRVALPICVYVAREIQPRRAIVRFLAHNRTIMA